MRRICVLILLSVIVSHGLNELRHGPQQTIEEFLHAYDDHNAEMLKQAQEWNATHE